MTAQLTGDLVEMGGVLSRLAGKPQLSTVAMDTASVLKERGHKNGHNRHILRLAHPHFTALRC